MCRNDQDNTISVIKGLLEIKFMETLSTQAESIYSVDLI